jgi:hypothetical protein
MLQYWATLRIDHTSSNLEGMSIFAFSVRLGILFGKIDIDFLTKNVSAFYTVEN